ncbi:hypothetical protein KI387_041446, partial [Taxus chinensis]
MVCVILSPQYDLLVLSCSRGSRKACNASINRSRYWDKDNLRMQTENASRRGIAQEYRAWLMRFLAGFYCESCNTKRPEPETIL